MASDNNYAPARPHPWHGLSVGTNPPEIVNVYVEMTPGDTVKYEIDKETGILTVDRPRQLSSQLPCAYGFIPRTYCDERVSALSDAVDEGDRDPLDICVISNCPIERTEILLSARIVGGLLMVDNGEADDKIIAVLEDDNVWGDATDIGGVPRSIVEKIRHYFLTYKLFPGEDNEKVSIDEVYGADHAARVLEASIDDYNQSFDD